jgi:hypothetical protein
LYERLLFANIVRRQLNCERGANSQNTNVISVNLLAQNNESIARRSEAGHRAQSNSQKDQATACSHLKHN